MSAVTAGEACIKEGGKCRQAGAGQQQPAAVDAHDLGHQLSQMQERAHAESCFQNPARRAFFLFERGSRHGRSPCQPRSGARQSFAN
jgi:hypothetical protein